MADELFQDLLPRSELAAPFWDAVRHGRLVVQRCSLCGHRWLPARRECPACLQVGARWVEVSGRARLVSWVVYHQALHAAFEAELPYNVAVVELEEGPRLISNIVGVDSADLRIDQPLQMVVRERCGIPVPLFAPQKRLRSSA